MTNMLTIQRLSMVSFILLTLISTSLLFYSTSVYLEVYDTLSKINVKINNIKVLSNSIETELSIINPTKFTIWVGSIWEELYLNGNFIGENSLYLSPTKRIMIRPETNETIKISILGNLNDKLDMSMSGTWHAKIIFWIYGIPLVEFGARFVRYCRYP